ncbi:MAG TPA: YEATS-associated helix-containing protein [Candidatus Angelobacter sp.]|nr:YEATS-associated helix-containing protein [Candidatus Angelobacter sp.]
MTRVVLVLTVIIAPRVNLGDFPVGQTTFFVVIGSIMVFSGLLGGLVNYFLSQKEDPEGRNFGKSAALGIAAALLVPLFLNMISSDLLDAIRKGIPGADGKPAVADLSKILVFLGFCLVAAISSTAFIKTLSDRILKEAKEAKNVARQADKKATATQSVIQPILDKETEAEVPTNANLALAATQPAIHPNERKLLESLAKGKSFRTRTGLGRETGIPRPEVEKMMDELKARGLVADQWIVITPGETKKRRWYITNNGRIAIGAP